MFYLYIDLYEYEQQNLLEYASKIDAGLLHYGLCVHIFKYWKPQRPFISDPVLAKLQMSK